MANWSNPTTSSLYTDVLDNLKDRDVDLAKMFDGTTSSNIPTGAIRWNSTTNKFEKWSGSAWGDLATTYALPSITASGDLTVSGNTTLGDVASDTVTINGTVQPGVVISGSSSGDAVRISQTGSGNALVVEDSTNPDATPFVVDAGGRTIIGDTTSTNVPNYAGTQIAAQLQGKSAVGYDGIGLQNYVAGSGSAGVTFAKSRSGALGTQTIVNSGDRFGSIIFSGSDGTSFVNGALIEATVDGTPGSSDMPGRLTFWTTADGASTPTERIRINNAGYVGIGATTLSPGTGMVRIAQSFTGATSVTGVFQAGTIQSDVTSNATGYTSQLGTAASSFTLTNLNQYFAGQATFGAGSTVTNQFGYQAASTLIGATNNYGFYSNIASGTSRTITTVDRTSNVVTITTSVAHGYTVGQSVTVAATTNTGINGTFTIASVPTTTTFTYAQTGTDIASGADTGTTVVVGRWNFYAAGTAPNFFGGATTISTSSTDAALRVTQTGTGNALVVEDSTNPDATPFVINTDGRVIINGTATVATPDYSTTTIGAFLQVQSPTSYNGASIQNYVNGNGASGLSFAKSRSGIAGSHTLVASGDRTGALIFSGSDGTAFIKNAQIEALIDGTPATNDMPGRLVFSTTASGASSASSPTERMRIDNAGRVGIGSTSLTNYGLRFSRAADSASYYGVASTYADNANSTTQSVHFYSISSTASNSGTPYTVGRLDHFTAAQSTFNADSTVTNQFGFRADNTLTGATNNYGFYGNIASGTSRTITTVDRTSNVVTITTSVAHGYTAGQSVTVAATTNTGINGTFTIASVPTTTTFTYAQTGTDIASGGDTGSTVVVGRWNFYAAGTASNYFAGNVGIGNTAPVNKLDLTGSFGRGAPVTKTDNFTLADTENWLICNGTGSITVTLPAASSCTGREFTIKTIAAQTVVSAASNVVPIDSATAGTAILAATAGKWAKLVSNGTNWVIMQSN